MLCASPDGRGIWGRMDALRMAETLSCSLELPTTFLTGFVIVAV